MTVKDLKQVLSNLESKYDDSKVLIAHEFIQEISDISVGVYDTASQGEVWDFQGNTSFEEIKKINTTIDALIISV
mgnify:CR=1 FL=1